MSLTDERFSLRCPNCNASYVYNVANLNAEGQVSCQNCGRWIHTEGHTVTSVYPESPTEPYVPYEQRSEETGMTIVKLFAHGFVFSLLSFFIVMVFVFVVAFLAFLGGIIGIVLSFIVLAAMLGGVNIGLASAIWGISTNSDTQSVIVQGGVIFILMVVLSMTLLPVSLFAYGIVLLLDFAFFPFLYGFVFRAVALQFQLVTEESVETISSDYRSGKCPNCGARYAYALSSRDEKGDVTCQNCSKEFLLQVGPDLA